ncbi:MAG TPA: hypothetical protein ENO18_03835 [Caldithrix sp.]|nr:hypothetical protein [Caldithrix sp.]
MEILFVNESIQSNYDDEDIYDFGDNFQIYFNFFIDISLNHALELHLNSNYGNFDSDNFKGKSHFPKYLSIDVYDVVSGVLLNLDETIYFYFSKARKLGEDIRKLEKYNDSISNIRIQFSDGSFLTFSQALDSIRTLFLQFMPKNVLFQFIKTLIFESNYRYGSAALLFKQSDIFDNTINFTALVYFIQKDLENITIEDFYKIKNDLLGLNIVVNPFFEHKADAIDKVQQLYENLNSIVIREGKHATKEERFKRIFDVYLLTTYQDVFFPMASKKIPETSLYVELRKLGYRFNEFDTPNVSTITTAEAAPFTKHIRDDKKYIKKIKNIEFKEYIYDHNFNFDQDLIL